MASIYVLDASALLAYLLDETGANQVEKILEYAIMSSVNYCEVLTYLNRENLKSNKTTTLQLLENSISKIIDFDKDQASVAASLYEKTKKYGLSFGDRACISLGLVLHKPVLTSDRQWLKGDFGIKVESIR